MLQKINKILKIPFFGKQKLLLSFEWGVMLANIARERGLEVDTEMYKRAERVLTNEFMIKTPTQLSTEIIPLMIAILESR